MPTPNFCASRYRPPSRKHYRSHHRSRERRLPRRGLTYGCCAASLVRRHRSTCLTVTPWFLRPCNPNHGRIHQNTLSRRQNLWTVHAHHSYGCYYYKSANIMCRSHQAVPHRYLRPESCSSNKCSLITFSLGLLLPLTACVDARDR